MTNNVISNVSPGSLSNDRSAVNMNVVVPSQLRISRSISSFPRISQSFVHSLGTNRSVYLCCLGGAKSATDRHGNLF